MPENISATEGNIFYGNYPAKPVVQVMGAWTQKEYDALPQERRWIIEDIASAILDDKAIGINEHHHLFENYQTVIDAGVGMVEQTMSDERVGSDLTQFLTDLVAAGKVRFETTPIEKHAMDQQLDTLRENVLKGVVKYIRKIRNVCEMLLQESVVNIIQHSMQHNPMGVGTIGLGMNQNGEFEICTYSEKTYDHLAAALAARQDENLEKNGGRGILLTIELTDEHKFSERGRCLRMRFHVRQEALTILLREAETLSVNIVMDHGISHLLDTPGNEANGP